jgi:hypothetical protein
LASLRGRALKRDGKNITDIDAIGLYNDQLLLVSCKSLVYDADYDRGTYRVVANASHTVDTAVKNWMRIADDLRLHPRGDNFGLTKYVGSIVAVVCTPFVVYSSNSDTLDYALPGLRRCIAPVELRCWLEADAGEEADVADTEGSFGNS